MQEVTHTVDRYLNTLALIVVGQRNGHVPVRPVMWYRRLMGYGGKGSRWLLAAMTHVLKASFTAAVND